MSIIGRIDYEKGGMKPQIVFSEVDSYFAKVPLNCAYEVDGDFDKALEGTRRLAKVTIDHLDFNPVTDGLKEFGKNILDGEINVSSVLEPSRKAIGAYVTSQNHINEMNQEKTNEAKKYLEQLPKNREKLNRINDEITLKEADFSEKFPNADLSKIIKKDLDSLWSNPDTSFKTLDEQAKIPSNLTSNEAVQYYNEHLKNKYDVRSQLENNINAFDNSKEVHDYLANNNGYMTYKDGNNQVTLALTNSEGCFKKDGQHIMREQVNLNTYKTNINYIPHGHEDAKELSPVNHIKENIIETVKYIDSSPRNIESSVAEKSEEVARNDLNNIVMDDIYEEQFTRDAEKSQNTNELASIKKDDDFSIG